MNTPRLIASLTIAAAMIFPTVAIAAADLESGSVDGEVNAVPNAMADYTPMDLAADMPDYNEHGTLAINRHVQTTTPIVITVNRVAPPLTWTCTVTGLLSDETGTVRRCEWK